MKHDIRLLFGPYYPDITESEILMKKYTIPLPKTHCQSLFQKMIQSEQSSDQAVLHFQMDGDTLTAPLKRDVTDTSNLPRPRESGSGANGLKQAAKRFYPLSIPGNIFPLLAFSFTF